MPIPITPITIPTPEGIYNSLMGKIEPELVTTELPTLKEKYKDETEEEKAKRVERYNRAFGEYEKALDAYFVELENKVKEIRKQAFASAEKEDFVEEQAQLAEMEATFAS